MRSPGCPLPTLEVIGQLAKCWWPSEMIFKAHKLRLYSSISTLRHGVHCWGLGWFNFSYPFQGVQSISLSQLSLPKAKWWHRHCRLAPFGSRTPRCVGVGWAGWGVCVFTVWGTGGAGLKLSPLREGHCPRPASSGPPQLVWMSLLPVFHFCLPYCCKVRRSLRKEEKVAQDPSPPRGAVQLSPRLEIGGCVAVSFPDPWRFMADSRPLAKGVGLGLE